MNTAIEALITKGWIVDIVIGIMLAEAAIMGVLMRKTGRSASYPRYLSGLAAGAFLVLALKSALTGPDWTLIAMFLALSFFAHILELRLAWSSR